MTHLPYVIQTFSIVSQDESHRSLLATLLDTFVSACILLKGTIMTRNESLAHVIIVIEMDILRLLVSSWMDIHQDTNFTKERLLPRDTNHNAWPTWPALKPNPAKNVVATSTMTGSTLHPNNLQRYRSSWTVRPSHQLLPYPNLTYQDQSSGKIMRIGKERNDLYHLQSLNFSSPYHSYFFTTSCNTLSSHMNKLIVMCDTKDMDTFIFLECRCYL